MEITAKNYKWQHISIIAFMAVLTLSLFGELLDSKKMLAASDQLTGMGNVVSMRQAMLNDGQFAYWNKGILGGMPMSEALGGDYLYPLLWPFQYLMPVYQSFAWSLIFHIFLAGLFFYLMLLKGFGLSPFIAGIGAVFYMLNPQFFSHLYPGHTGKVYVIAWLPYIVWRLKVGLDSPNLKNTALLALGIGFGLLSSHIQMMYFVFMGIGATWLFFTVSEIIETKNIKSVSKQAIFFWGAVLGGLSLGAVQFYPAFQFVQDAHSVRGIDRGFEFASSWSLHWAEVFSLWVPEFGNWFDYYWGENYFKLNTEYVGAVAMLTAALAFVFKPTKWRFFWLGFGVLIVLLSLGASSVVYRLAYDLVFGIKKFRAISMAMFWFSFVTVLLSALALKDIMTEEWKNFNEIRLKRTKAGLLISLFAVVFISLIFANQSFVFDLMRTLGNPITERENVFDVNFKRNYIPALIGWATLAVIILTCVWAVICGHLKKEIALTVILVLGMVDLLRINTQFISIGSNAQFRRVPVAVKEVLDKTKNDPARSMFLRGTSNNANIESFYGLEGINGFHDNELARYREFRGQNGVNYYSEGSNELNIANCKYIFYGMQTGQLAYFENPHALGRLAFTDKYRVEERDNISQILRNPIFPSHNTVIIERAPDFKSSDFANTAISVKWIKYTANERLAEVTVETAGLLRISEVFYDGWSVYLNGRKQEIINSDLAFMAIEIPAGKHEVLMKIKSPYIGTAILLSIPGCILLLAAVIGSSRFSYRKTK